MSLNIRHCAMSVVSFNRASIVIVVVIIVVVVVVVVVTAAGLF